MIRKETYTIEKILPLIGAGKKVDLDGDMINMRSVRLLNFKVHGITCVTCGLTGSYFAKEKSHKRDASYHLNLYAIRESDGKHILMTRDHIIPVSLNGDNTLKNSQTMCSPCNCRKGNGRNKSTFKKDKLARLLTCGFTPAMKKAIELETLIGDDEKLQEAFNLFILSLNKTFCKSMPTRSLTPVPEEMTLEEFDSYHKTQIPVGKKAVIVPCEGGLYLFRKDTGERLHIQVKGNF